MIYFDPDARWCCSYKASLERHCTAVLQAATVVTTHACQHILPFFGLVNNLGFLDSLHISPNWSDARRRGSSVQNISSIVVA